MMTTSFLSNNMYTHMPTAYTPVSTRRTLGVGASAPMSHSYQSSSDTKSATQSQSSPTQGKITWPLPVREYVSRSFATENQIRGVSLEDAQEKLRVVINDAVTNDQLNSLDWAKYPLPQQIIVTERQQAAYAITNSTAWHNNSPALAFSTDKSTNQTPNKKRKSSELEPSGEVDISSAPWRQNKDGNSLEDRLTYSSSTQAKRMEKRQRKLKDSPPSNLQSGKSHGEIEKRKQRFGFNGNQEYQTASSRDDSPSGDVNSGPVIGTCPDLEKTYFRLTAPPKPETVRPLPVLEKSFAFLKTKWRTESNYTYICDQFKSLRQDLTVQHIKNEFTVDVYELHARIALEKGDMGEYNQCQTQLRALYKQKLGGNSGEFLAYRILYFIYTCNRTDMNDVLADLTPADRELPAVKHALEVRSALALRNYHRFFKLTRETPNMGEYLLDMILERERVAALANICKSFRPDLDLKFVSDELSFESEQECCQFICERGGEMLFDKKPEGIRFKCSAGLPIFEAKKNEAFKRIDIKGQI